jgi:hypothetical protein
MFIIFGIIIVAIIALFFVFHPQLSPFNKTSPETSEAYLKNCLEDNLKNTLQKIFQQGGYINNSLDRKFKFSDEEEFTDISYLCYNKNNYLPCINQEPMLIQHLEEEINNEMAKQVEKCVQDLKDNLNENNGEKIIYNGFEVKMFPKKIILDFNMSLILEQTGERTLQENFEIVYPTRFYDLAIVVQEIVSQEARFCHFESQGFNLLYPEFKIKSVKTPQLDKIYRVTNTFSGEDFKFAVKSCSIPPGI